MIKKFIIKKLLIFFISLTFTIIVFSCGANNDNTNQFTGRKNDNAMIRDSMNSRIP